ncbi:DUF4168 domain-containing protein [uncultured Microbulbifer sp.]|uniref:DUF4168 domain-containing protein n=1 Tax=uncultured Microbulbifer sp. TaxID=348147 RepID=UPI0026046F63|nr:DUF4168 domain-containing protein [uncultured Microbulbifer sp.]
MNIFRINSQSANFNSRPSLTRGAIFTTAVVFGALTLTAHAQTGNAPEHGTAQAASPYSSAQDTADAANFSDEKLKSFVEVRKEVDETREKINAKLQQEDDPSKAMEIRTEGNQRMLTAVENAGFSTDEYNAIARAVAMDPELAARVEEMR